MGNGLGVAVGSGDEEEVGVGVTVGVGVGWLVPVPWKYRVVPTAATAITAMRATAKMIVRVFATVSLSLLG
jgi:hypothetical protein